MATRRRCAYAGKQSAIIPPCDGPIEFVVRGYWRGEARKRLGPDMYLCTAHGEWSAKVNPLGFTRERIR